MTLAENTPAAPEPLTLEVIGFLKSEGEEKFSFHEEAKTELAPTIESYLEEDAKIGRMRALIELVKLARVLEINFKSPETAKTLRSILEASPSGLTLFTSFEDREGFLRDTSKKFTGLERVLPAQFGVQKPANGVRAALVLPKGALDERRARPSFAVQRMRPQAEAVSDADRRRDGSAKKRFGRGV